MDKIQCKYCKKIFLNYISNHRKYCSKKCRNKDWSIILKSKHHRYWLGKHRSEETKNKIRKNGNFNIKGKNHPAWKGGISLEEKRIRNGLEMILWRQSVFARDNWTCQMCNKRGSRVLNAHHIKSFKNFPKLRTAINNGITLCINCHHKSHKRRKNE